MDKKEKSKVLVPIVCFLLSIGLWFYVTNVENKIRTTEISKIPVELINVESLTGTKLALAPNQELYVTLRVEGNSNYINKIKKSDFKVQVDLSEYAWKKGENKVPVSIIDYPIAVSIRNTNTLTVGINIEDMIEKSMKVTSDIKLIPKQGYFVSEAEVNPSEVKVIGAESAVNRVAKLVVSDKKEEVFEDVVLDCTIKALDEKGNEVKEVILSEKSANIAVKVSKGKSVKVNVVTSGELADGLKLNSMEVVPKTVEILGPKEVLDSINEINTTVLDLGTITDSKDLNLEIVLPEGIEVAQGDKYVTIKLSIIKFKTRDFNVKYEITGGIEGLKFILNKDNIKITIGGYEDEISNITLDNIKAVVDVSHLKEVGNFEVEPKITLQGLSEGATIVSTEKVTITVSKEEVEEDSTTTSSENN